MNTSGKQVLVVGDSHIKYFLRGQHHGLYLPRQMDGIEVGGATAVPMRNPNAATNALDKFRKFLENKDTEAVVVLQLGEADCGFAAWLRAETLGEAVSDQTEQAVAAYFAFVDELIARGFKNLVITSATLPTITDDEQAGGVVPRRSAISASQRERTELTVLFNQQLCAEAGRRGLAFVDVTPDVLDADTGLARNSFRNADLADHHMNYRRAAVMWAKHLKPVLDAIDPASAPRKTWRVVNQSFAKALFVHSRDLPPELKVALSPGDLITGGHVADYGELVLVEHATLNGVALDPQIRIFHRQHTRIMPEPVAEAEPAAAPEAGLEAAPEAAPELTETPAPAEAPAVLPAEKRKRKRFLRLRG